MEGGGELITPTRSRVSLERGGPAGGLSQQRRAQQQQQQQPGGGRGRQGGLARVGAPAAPQLRLAAALLALQACVARGTVAADVVDTHPAILAALELVVTHPGCVGAT